MTLEQQILGALARGYCTERNKNKILDPDLLEDIAIEVMMVIESFSNDRGML